MQREAVLLSYDPTNPHSVVWCSTGVHSAAAVESGPALRYLQHWNQQPANVAHIHNQANRMTGISSHLFKTQINCKLHKYVFSKLAVFPISTFRMSEIVMESQTGHRPHTLELCLICIKFRIFSIYPLHLLLITDLQYWNVEIFPGNRNLNKVFVQQKTFVEFLLLFSSTVGRFEKIYH